MHGRGVEMDLMGLDECCHGLLEGLNESSLLFYPACVWRDQMTCWTVVSVMIRRGPVELLKGGWTGLDGVGRSAQMLLCLSDVNYIFEFLRFACKCF